MPLVHYQHGDAAPVALEVADDSSLMRAAVDAGLPGIIGECGGAAMCGTCHVLVDAAWLERLPPMSRNEDELLDCTAAPRQPNSRLACQLRMHPGLNGLAVRTPDCQR